MSMSPTLLRQLWTIIESIQTSILLEIDDMALVQLLLKQVAAKQPIDAMTSNNLNQYIQSSLPLIRDTAESRNFV